MPFKSAKQRKFFAAKLDKAGISESRKLQIMERFKKDKLTAKDRATLRKALR